jgi:death-on-curing protein
VIFLTKADLLLVHDRILEATGGESGPLHEGSLDAAILALRNRQHYEGAGLAPCAASYAFHLVRAHAFVDENKRIGVAAAETFLVANAARLEASDDEIHDLVLAIASGSMARDDVDRWMEARVRTATPPR